jgi:hypothetical protein
MLAVIYSVDLTLDVLQTTTTALVSVQKGLLEIHLSQEKDAQRKSHVRNKRTAHQNMFAASI